MPNSPELNPAQPQARLEVSRADSGQQSGLIRIRITGRLHVHSAANLWTELDNKFLDLPEQAGYLLDLSGLEYMDTAGAALIQEITSRLGQERMSLVRAHAQHKQMLDLFADFSAQAAVPSGLRNGFLSSLGASARSFAQDTSQLIDFVGQFTRGLFQALLHPGKVRWREVFSVAENLGVRALLIIFLIGFLLGLIISFQSAIPLRMFGAEIFVAQLLGLSIFRELGPLVTAIILAGRSGSSFAAELGTMKINEELSALQTMGLDPLRFLIVPRMLAAMIMTPLLTIFFNLFSLIGGAVVMLSMGYPLVTYLNQMGLALQAGDILGGLFKAFVFSILVAWIGCVRGLQTGSGASAVGLSTTRAVVSGIILIAVMDGVFALVFYSLGI